MDSVYLQGSEDVRRAGSVISSAADTMSSAASNIQHAVEVMGRMLSAHEENMTVLLEQHRTELAKIMAPRAFANGGFTQEQLSELIDVKPGLIIGGRSED